MAQEVEIVSDGKKAGFLLISSPLSVWRQAFYVLYGGSYIT